MSKTVEQVIQDTEKALLNALSHFDDSEEQREPEKQIKQVERVIRTQLRKAFKATKLQDRSELFKKLSLKLHPDHMAQTRTPLAVRLQALVDHNSPQKILNEFKPKSGNLFTSTLADTKNGMKDLLEYVEELFEPMTLAHDRYFEPFRTLTKIFSIIVDIIITLIIIPVALVIICLLVIQGVLSFFNTLILNLVTNGLYNQNVEIYKDNPELKAAAEMEYAGFIRSFSEGYLRVTVSQEEAAAQMDEMDSMSIEELLLKAKEEMLAEKMKPFEGLQTDAEMLAALKQRFTEDIELEIQNGIKNFIFINDFDRLNLITRSFYEALSRPLPDNWLAAAFSIVIVKPLQLLISPVVILTSLGLTGLEYFNVAAMFATVGIGAAIKGSSLVLTNSPLYALDVGRYVGKKLVSSVKENEDNSETSGLIKGSNVRLGHGSDRKNSREPREPYQGAGAEGIYSTRTRVSDAEDVIEHRPTTQLGGLD